MKRKDTFLFCKNSGADLIFLQETHSSESDVKFWKRQWGNKMYCSHGTNHSAGVSILLHKFKGEILEMVSLHDGRWILIIFKHDNSNFIVCNIYGHNLHLSNKIHFNQITSKINDLSHKYPNSYVISGGDFNECPDDAIDRFPQKLSIFSEQ